MTGLQEERAEVAQSGGWPSYYPRFPARLRVCSGPHQPLLPCWGHCTFATGAGLPLTICAPHTHLVSGGMMFAEPHAGRCWKAFLSTSLGLSASRCENLTCAVYQLPVSSVLL